MNMSNKILGIGDIHLKPTYNSRLDDVKKTFENKISSIKKICEELKPDRIVCTGDWFEDKNPYNCSPGFLAWALGLLTFLDTPIYSIVGNHDIRNNDIGTLRTQPLGVLISAGAIQRLFNEDGGYDYGEDLLEKAKEPRSPGGLGVFHCYTSESGGSMFGNEIVYPLKLFGSFGYSHVLIGHDHQCYDLAKVRDTWVHRPGSLFRMRRDDVDLNRSIKVSYIDLGGGKPEYLPIEHQPASKVFDMKVKEVVGQMDQNITSFVKSLSGIRSASSAPIEDQIKTMGLSPEVSYIINDSLDKAKQE